jgi:hypothetical protein
MVFRRALLLGRMPYKALSHDVAAGSLFEIQLKQSFLRHRNAHFFDFLGKVGADVNEDLLRGDISRLESVIRCLPRPEQVALLRRLDARQYASNGIYGDVHADIILAGMSRHGNPEAMSPDELLGVFEVATDLAVVLNDPNDKFEKDIFSFHNKKDTIRNPNKVDIIDLFSSVYFLLGEITVGPSQWAKKVVQLEKGLCRMYNPIGKPWKKGAKEDHILPNYNNTNNTEKKHHGICVIVLNESEKEFRLHITKLCEYFSKLQEIKGESDTPHLLNQVVICVFVPFRNCYAEIHELKQGQREMKQDMNEMKQDMNELKNKVEEGQREMKQDINGIKEEMNGIKTSLEMIMHHLNIPPPKKE